jgi:general nucleoside transport system ATP-binding protein
VSSPALELRGVAKRFGPVQALRGADFTLGAGEVHALLGENGAGKSTLMHLAYGLVRADAGTMRVRGHSGWPHSPREARGVGIGMVHQHFTAIPALTVAENVALAAGWSVRPALLQRRVEQLIDRVGLPLDPTARAGDLGVALRQRLEILKALATSATILLLDEPTAVLAPAEADELLRLARRMAADGGSVVLITHKLEEALRTADRVTVLRSGRVSLTGLATEQSPESLAAAMIGSAGTAPGPVEKATEGGGQEIRVRCVGLDVRREDGPGLALREANLTLAGGEVVGVAAVEGNGARELLRTMAGLLRPLAGLLEVDQPVAFIPGDRTTEGLIGDLDLTHNVVLGLGRTAPWVHGWRLDWTSARARTAGLIEQFAIQAPGPDAFADTLSGGNQQKLVIARALELRPRVVIAENPTRGLDVRATRTVWRRLHDAAGSGAAVIVYSTDLDEVLDQAARIFVVAKGRIAPAAPGAGRAVVGAMMLGAEPAGIE